MVYSKSQLKSAHSSDRVYLPFVGTATLHPKLLTSTDIRERDYDIPQLCYGCRKFMEFTHAQHSSTRAYVHFDESSTAKSFREDESVHEPYDQPADMSHAVNLVEFPKRGKFCHGCEISSEPQWVKKRNQVTTTTRDVISMHIQLYVTYAALFYIMHLLCRVITMV